MHRKIIILLLSFLGTAAGSVQETVYRHPDYTGSLKQRREWAEQKVRDTHNTRNHWIAYSFEKMMGEHSFTGSWRGERDTRKTLQELIYGTSPAGDSAEISDAELIRREARTVLEQMNNDDHPEQRVMKEIAVCFHYGDHNTVDDVRLSNLSLPVDLDGDPLFWLGKAPVGESIDFLTSLYKKAAMKPVRKDLISAVGIHPPSDEAFTFLSSLVRKEKNDTLREQAVFWIAMQDGHRALPVIVTAAKEDDSPQVQEKAVFAVSLIHLPEAEEAMIDLADSGPTMHIREQAVFWMGQNGGEKALAKLKQFTEKNSRLGEKAVFAISQIDGEKAEQVLIDLARHASSKAIRKKAIFWLGQKASKKAQVAVRETVYKDDETEIQEAALFALSRMPADISVPELIHISKTHTHFRIRKKAIFWLGQSDDTRAADYLAQLIAAH